MTDHPAAAIEIDRLALSNELLALADRFALESTLWREPGCRDQLATDARLLATLGRAVLATADPDVARAYAEGATRVIRNVEGTRRFFQTVLTPPASEGE